VPRVLVLRAHKTSMPIGIPSTAGYGREKENSVCTRETAARAVLGLLVPCLVVVLL